MSKLAHLIAGPTLGGRWPRWIGIHHFQELGQIHAPIFIFVLVRVFLGVATKVSSFGLAMFIQIQRHWSSRSSSLTTGCSRDQTSKSHLLGTFHEPSRHGFNLAQPFMDFAISIHDLVQPRSIATLVVPAGFVVRGIGVQDFSNGWHAVDSTWRFFPKANHAHFSCSSGDVFGSNNVMSWIRNAHAETHATWIGPITVHLLDQNGFTVHLHLGKVVPLVTSVCMSWIQGVVSFHGRFSL
mmetsp:Transcript_14091/g.34140  ORF Transcript_14091/g.34140 Transcript_14091/m.34140 type:complete len:239 (+) Transcript_14091:1315-2031(+)